MLEYVTLARKLTRKLELWAKKVCKFYGDISGDVLPEGASLTKPPLSTDFPGRRDALEKISIDLLIRYDRLMNDAAKLRDEFDKFRGETDEPFIKWVGEDFFSSGYLGLREETKEVFIMDINVDTPYGAKLPEIFFWFGIVPPAESEAREQALSYLEWKKPDFTMDKIRWLLDYHYPLTEFKFLELLHKVTMVPSIKDAWEETLERKKPLSAQRYPEQWNKIVEVIGEFDVEKYVEDLIQTVVNEMVEKYGHTFEPPEVAVEDLNRRTGEVLMERVPPDSTVENIYEQVKPLYPEKVEPAHTAMLKSIRYAFLHPEVEVDSYASSWIFPMDFTDEEARAIAGKILETITGIPPTVTPLPPEVAPPPPKPEVEVRVKLWWGMSTQNIPTLLYEVYVNGERRSRGFHEFRPVTKEELEKEIRELTESIVREAGVPFSEAVKIEPSLEVILASIPTEIIQLEAPQLKDILWDKFSESLRAKGLDPELFRSEFEADYADVKELRREHAQRTIESKAEEIARREVGPLPVKPVEVKKKPPKPSVVEQPSKGWNEKAEPAEIPLIVKRPPTKEELEAEAEEREAKKLGIPLTEYKEIKKTEALPTDEDKVMNLHLARFSEEYISKDLPLPLEDVKRIIKEHEIKSRYLEGTPVERIVEDTGLTTDQVKVIVEKKGYYG